ncbi:MAG: ABC transporter substrate-binding protein [Cyclobacteriaceae bacterium]
MKSYTFKTLVLSLVFALLASCSAKKESSQSSELTKIKIGYIPIADCGQIFVAQDQEFFKKNGLDVELVKLSGGAKILEALAGGSVDIAFSNVVSVMLANNAGLAFRPITGGPRTDSLHQETGLLVLSESSIDTPNDLKGKKIAVNTKKNIVELFVLEFLEIHGLQETDLEFVEIPFPQMYQVLDSKNIDAAAVFEPFVTFSMQSGNVSNLGDYLIPVLSNLEISTYNASESWISKNPETVACFQKSIEEASIYANNNRKELERILTLFTSLNQEQLSQVVLPYYGDKVDAASFGQILDLVKKRGWVQENLEASTILH